MKFRRKSAQEAQEALDAEAAAAAAAAEPVSGPFDADEALPEGGAERVDLGSLLLTPSPGLELRLQVNEVSGEVQAVMLAGTDGMIELRAFAAPRNGDLWSDVRAQISAEMTQKGGTVSEREGRFGPELVCTMPVTTAEGAAAVQPSRVLGVNGPRWFLRATLLGRPALESVDAESWEDAVADVAVRRGAGAMIVGEPLPVNVPSGARRLS